MTIQYVDAHCHIQFDQYAKDYEELIGRMRESGVSGVVVGVDYASSQKAVMLAQRHSHLFASVGLHPNRVHETFDAEKYRILALNPTVVALGECGLDYFRPEEVNDELKKKQKSLLHAHIKLAAELDKPLIIHARPSQGTQDAYLDLIALLGTAKQVYPNIRGDVHFFVGGIREARALIELDFTVSYTAVVTFARDYDETIRSLPRESIMSETDAPYVAPVERRGQRNDPLAVIAVVEKLAQIRGEPVEAVRAALAANALKLFKLPAEIV